MAFTAVFVEAELPSSQIQHADRVPLSQRDHCDRGISSSTPRTRRWY